MILDQANAISKVITKMKNKWLEIGYRKINNKENFSYIQ